MLDFVIPVRHPSSVPDWGVVKTNLAATLASIAAQDQLSWRCVVVANDGAELPPLPAGVRPVRVSLPLPMMPDPSAGEEAGFNLVRDDKGARVLAGLQAQRSNGHVMVVDYDDLVSPRLASVVSTNATAPGWYLDAGYLFSGRGFAYLYPRGFFETCGTSLIIRHDLLLPDLDAPSADDIRYRLGSHKFMKRWLAEAGTPLLRLPFPGASYRIGHAGQTSGSKGVLGRVFSLRSTLRRPWQLPVKISRLRPASAMF